jgi:enoyl-CoA hydratase
VASELVHYGVSGGVATITLDSPANRNALSGQLLAELFASLAVVHHDESARVVVLTHTGSVFCAGADLREAAEGGMVTRTRALLRLLHSIVSLPKPVVARIGGTARAGGLGLVGACDIAIAAEGVSFAFTEARLGLAPAVISLTTLPRMEPRTAARWFLSGELFDAPAAVRAGLLTRAVPAADLDFAVRDVVESLRHSSPQGLAATKQLLTQRMLQDFAERGATLVEMSARLFSSKEAREGMRAFLDHRPPRWVS